MSASFGTVREQLWYQGLLLGLVAFVASGALLIASRVTAPAIAARDAEDLAASLTQALPGVQYDNNLTADSVRIDDSESKNPPTVVYRARRKGTVQAVAFETVGYGYSGAIRIVMGVDREGRILSVRVLAHRETPGLGDRIEITKSRWIENFKGLTRDDPPADKWRVKKDGGQFDQFTGATITPRAVVKAVKEGLDLFAAHKNEMLSQQSTGDHP